MNKNYSKQKNKGAAMILFLLFFLMASSALVYTISRSVYFDLLTHRLSIDSAQSYFTAESAIEDMAYRYIAGLTPDATEIFSFYGAVATSTAVYDSFDDAFYIVSSAVKNNSYRTSALTLYTGSGASFNFGVQSGNGGFTMANGSSVQGNVFSNGTIEQVLGGSATIYGDVISAGPAGYIFDIVATGTARARVIKNTSVGADAYAYTLDGGSVAGDAYIYEKIGGAVVVGSEYPNEAEQATTTLPISDEAIDKIKQDIIDSGTVISSTSTECAGGEYFTEDDLTLGFVKIECDFRVKKKGPGGTVLTLTGPLWVEGDITFEAGPDVEIDAGVGNRTVPVVADNESNRSTSSSILVQNGTTFTGSGSPKSYVLLISQNEDSENGAPEDQDAIRLEQSSSGDLLVYAGHGRVSLGNSVSLKEITGYLIALGNSSEVIYESGLVNLLFTSGPGGGFSISDWGEIF